MFRKLVLATLVLLFAITGVWAQSVGDYRSKATGNWNNLATWETWNGTAWVDAVSLLGSTTAVAITIREGHTVTHNVNTYNAGSANAVHVSGGGTLIINNSNSWWTQFASLSIYENGSLTQLVGGVKVSGATSIAGTFVRSSTIATSFDGACTVNNTGIYRHNINGGAIPVLTWEVGSTLEITGLTTTMLTATGTYQNVVWNCTNQGTNNIVLENNLNSISGNFTIQSTGSTGNLVLGNTSTDRAINVNGNFVMSGGNFALKGASVAAGVHSLNVNGNFLQSAGTFTFTRTSGAATTSNLSVKGNFTLSGGLIQNSTNNDPFGSIVFNGSGVQVYTKSGGSFSRKIDFYISGSSSLDLGTSVIDGSTGNFSLSSGATLITANPEGISLSGATGSVRVTGSRTYNEAANYTYNGSVAQVTGNGLTTANNLSINNAGGLTLSANTTVNGTLIINSGSLHRGEYSLSLDAYINNADYLSIAADDNNIANFSALTSVSEANFPAKIKRQWEIGGSSANAKIFTFSWTEADDEGFGWDFAKSDLQPAVYVGATKLSTLEINARSISVNVPAATLPAIFTIGRADGNTLSAFDFPLGIAVSQLLGAETIELTVTSGAGLDIAPAGILPIIPNSGGSFETLWLRGTGIQSFEIQTLSPWGAVYFNSNWHAYARNAAEGKIVFANIDFDAKADLPIILGDVDPTLPVELSSFTALVSAGKGIQILWTAQSETNLQGYYLLRANEKVLGSALTISALIEAANTSTTTDYQFVDRDLGESGNYYYWLQCVDLDGSLAYHGPLTVYWNTSSDEVETPIIPIVAGIHSIFPNPFNPHTSITYNVKKDKPVSIAIYNARGQTIKSIILGTQSIGTHHYVWDGKDSNGNTCHSGVYFFRLNADGKSFVRKAVLMK